MEIKLFIKIFPLFFYINFLQSMEVKEIKESDNSSSALQPPKVEIQGNTAKFMLQGKEYSVTQLEKDNYQINRQMPQSTFSLLKQALISNQLEKNKSSKPIVS